MKEGALLQQCRQPFTPLFERHPPRTQLVSPLPAAEAPGMCQVQKRVRRTFPLPKALLQKPLSSQSMNLCSRPLTYDMNHKVPALDIKPCTMECCIKSTPLHLVYGEPHPCRLRHITEGRVIKTQTGSSSGRAGTLGTRKVECRGCNPTRPLRGRKEMPTAVLLVSPGPMWSVSEPACCHWK